MSETPKTNFICPDKGQGCDFETTDVLALNAHVDERHSVKKFRCAHCQFRSNFRARLIAHIANDHMDDVRNIFCLCF